MPTLRPVYRFPAPPDEFWRVMASRAGTPLAPCELPEPLLACSGIPNGLHVYPMGNASWIAESYDDVIAAVKRERPHTTIELASLSDIGG